MNKFEYEKNNFITSAKNEIYGIKQLMETLEKLKEADYTKVENKAINKKIITFLNEATKSYFYFSDNYNYDKLTIGFMVDDRYNKETKNYIDFYEKYTLSFKINIDANYKKRFSVSEFLIEIDFSLEYLENKLQEIEYDLNNVDDIVKEYQEIHNQIIEFKNKRCNFFKDKFDNLNRFY